MQNYLKVLGGSTVNGCVSEKQKSNKICQRDDSFEAWTGKKPKVDYLRVFGCIAYAHIPKDERKKLDSKAKKCIFLGYGTETKGYRLYDLKKAKVFYSRDVIFNESERAVEEPERDKEGAANIMWNLTVKNLTKKTQQIQRHVKILPGTTQPNKSFKNQKEQENHQIVMENG